jgi:SAM-dependent methyltransferase
MPESPAYTGLVAQAWDLLRGDTSAWPDRAFYRGIIAARGGPVLDVGCGTGRLLLDYLAEGFDVDGVDNAPQMLALCRAKADVAGIDVAGRLFAQEMDALALPRRYETVLVPSSSFQLLTDADAARRALAGFREHLVEGGVLVMSIMSKLWPGKRPPAQMEWSDWFNTGERVRPQDGATVRRWIRARHDHAQQLQDEENRYEVLRDGVVVQTELHARSPAARWYTQAQIARMYRDAGFSNVTVTANFTFDAAAPDHTTFCVTGQRP